MAANGVPMTEPEAETSGPGRFPLVPIEILEDPYTPTAEVKRIAADVARRASEVQTSYGRRA